MSNETDRSWEERVYVMRHKIMEQQNEKMRAEFESFWNAPEQEELRMSCAKGWAFEVWQASRAALVVDLPRVEMGWVDHQEVIEAIEAAGVRVNP